MQNLILRAALAVLLIGGFTANAEANTWKSIFISGDDSIANFDKGRDDLAAMLGQIGTVQAIHHSSAPLLTRVGSPIRLATIRNIADSFSKLDVKADEGCFVHMTSHGIKNGGFYLTRDQPLLPSTFAKMVNSACGDQPTVILISACYSGQFITDELKGDNRVIMTAAIADRPSFGCSPDTEYTYWDGCLLSEIPKSQTWNDVYANVKTCVEKKEQAIGVRPSLPQAFFGTNTNGWVILE